LLNVSCGATKAARSGTTLPAHLIDRVLKCMQNYNTFVDDWMSETRIHEST
jgi:hypothetical protein